MPDDLAACRFVRDLVTICAIKSPGASTASDFFLSILSKALSLCFAPFRISPTSFKTHRRGSCHTRPLCRNQVEAELRDTVPNLSVHSISFLFLTVMLNCSPNFTEAPPSAGLRGQSSPSPPRLRVFPWVSSSRFPLASGMISFLNHAQNHQIA